MEIIGDIKNRCYKRETAPSEEWLPLAWHAEEEIRQRINEYHSKNYKNIRVLLPYFFNLENALIMSGHLTEKTGCPVIVLPNSPTSEQKTYKLTEYCQIKCKVVAHFEEYKLPFNLFNVHSFYDETADKIIYRVSFIGHRKPSARWDEEPFRHFKFERYSYHAISEDGVRFLLFSTNKLELGKDYEACGLFFDIRKADTGINIGKRSVICLATCVSDIRDTVIKKEVLQKCKGKSWDYFLRSATYPFSNMTNDFAELIATNLFHVDTGFPYNIILCGHPNRTKTAVLFKIASITRDEILETGSSSIKGLLPSFSSTNANCGVLAESHYKALINEFFDLLNRVGAVDRPAYLNGLKSVLEGKSTTFRTGNGSATIRMKGDMVAATNFPRSEHGGRWMRSILEIYQHYDPAFCDRVLFYSPPTEQERLVDEAKDRISNLLRQTGKKDELDQLKELDYGELLNPTEIRSLMDFAKTLTVNVQDIEYQRKLSIERRHKIYDGVFSRHSEYTLNIATAYAFIRNITEETIDEKTKIIQVLNDDLLRASNFLVNLLQSYQEENPIRSRLRIARIMALTPVEKTIFLTMLDRYKDKIDASVHLKKISLGELIVSFSKEYPTLEIEEAVNKLIDKDLIVCDGQYLMFFPELSEEANMLFKQIKLKKEFKPEPMHEIIAKSLVRRGIVGYDQFSGVYSSIWVSDGKKLQVEEIKQYTEV